MSSPFHRISHSQDGMLERQVSGFKWLAWVLPGTWLNLEPAFQNPLSKKRRGTKKPRRGGVSFGIWPSVLKNESLVTLVFPAKSEDLVESSIRTRGSDLDSVRFRSLVSCRCALRPKPELAAVIRPISKLRWLFPSSKRLW